MPTLNKLEYLDETKHQIKTALNTKFNSGITEEDTFRSYVSKINNIYNNWPKVTGEDTTLSLTPTKKGKMDLDLKGNTSQFTTTGKNLFDKDNVIKVDNKILNDSGVETSDNTGGYTKMYIPVNPNTTYTISGLQTNGTKRIYFFDNSKGFISKTSSQYNVSSFNFTTPNNCYYIDIQYYLINNNFNTYQIEQGSTATSYEKYTGGNPAPNPDYPQDVQVVTGNNSIIIEGKNKFNIDDAYYKRLNTGTVTINNNNIIVENVSTTAHQFVWWNIPIMVGEEITISYNSLTESPSDNNNGVFYTFNDEPYTSFVSFDGFIKVDKTNKYSTTTATKKYLVVGLRTVPSCTNTLNKLQIEKGSTASEYKEFQGRQTYSVNLGNIELCKIGDYQDRIAKSSGKNLFDKDSQNIIANKYLDDSGVETNDNNFSISDYIKVDANTVYSSQPFEHKSACICFYNSSKTFLSSKRLTQIQPNFTTPNNCEYIRTSIWKADINILQIEKGSTATSYEPYGKVWYLNKQIGKVVLDGSEEWQLEINATNYYEYKYFTGYNSSANISSHFDGTTNSRITIAYNYLYLRFPKSAGIDVSTVELFKTWLSNNNITIYYKKATPTITEITDTTLIEQLDNLENAYSYDTQTNISQTNDNLGFIISAAALMKGGN